jgi:hypothetical protein
MSENEEFEFRARAEKEKRLRMQQTEQPSGQEASPGAQTAPMPSMGEVALNAVPKGVANFLNTPNTISHLLLKGVASIPGMDSMPEVKKFLEEGAEKFGRNGPMHMMETAGLVDPAKNPQTGLQRVVDTAVQSAVGALGFGGGAAGAAMGAVSGTASQAMKEATGSDALAIATGLAAPYAAQKVVSAGAKAVDAVRGAGKTSLLEKTGEATFRKAREMGMVVEPSKVRGPSDMVESIAGKAKIAQETVEHNAKQATLWAKRELKLPDDTPLSRDLLDAYKKKVIQPYREVDQVFQQAKATGTLPYFPRYHSQSLTDEFVEASQDAKALWRSYSESQVKDINVLKAAKAADGKVAAIVNDIDMVAKHAGVPDLPARVMAAKQLYAKANDVETALNPGSGHVSLPVLASLRRESNKLTGRLKDLGDFALQFPRSARELERSAPSGVSGTDAGMGATLATVGAAGSGSLAGMAAGGLPLLRGPAGRRVLSDTYQDSLLDFKPKSSAHIPRSAVRAGAGAAGNTILSNRENKQ